MKIIIDFRIKDLQIASLQSCFVGDESDARQLKLKFLECKWKMRRVGEDVRSKVFYSNKVFMVIC